MDGPHDPPRLPRSDEGGSSPGPLTTARRRGIGLCLSGGGFRAALFHAGALRRLGELGLLSGADLRTVAAVSGGAIAAGALATALHHLVLPSGRPIPTGVWNAEVWDPLRAFTRKDARTGPLLRRLLPWNILRTSASVEALARGLERDLTRLRLSALPARPEFLFLSTEMSYGVAWVFARETMGDYVVGYLPPPAAFPLARAVAASACFPPAFGPMRLRLEPDALRGGTASREAVRRACRAGLPLTDGGTYDNMGLEPVWKDHAAVLVSDAGGIFTGGADRGLLWRIPRYVAIQERQSRALRKRWLVASFATGVLDGAYWGVASAPSHYDQGYQGYSKELARDVIAAIRTDLDAFSEAEAGVLENHGYLLADAALRRHLPSLVPVGTPAAVVPHPEWFPPTRMEAEIREALRGSGKRRLIGRR